MFGTSGEGTGEARFSVFSGADMWEGPKAVWEALLQRPAPGGLTQAR